MKYNYPPLDGKCVKCIGCNRLENYNFKGVCRCENYIEKRQKKNDR
jgi:hypothetical protein